MRWGAISRVFGRSGKWTNESGTLLPRLFQGRNIPCANHLGKRDQRQYGFVTMVATQTPVFWSFFFLAGVSVFVLRKKDASTPRVFSVPLYPVTPILFCVIGLYMFQNGISYIMLLPRIGLYSGAGAAIGLAVLLLGIPLYFWNTLDDENKSDSIRE
jgi:amino acid transporter